VISNDDVNLKHLVKVVLARISSKVNVFPFLYLFFESELLSLAILNIEGIKFYILEFHKEDLYLFLFVSLLS
jgi:hypothetical protein